jgi:hypothetical protein
VLFEQTRITPDTNLCSPAWTVLHVSIFTEEDVLQLPASKALCMVLLAYSEAAKQNIKAANRGKYSTSISN